MCHGVKSNQDYAGGEFHREQGRGDFCRHSSPYTREGDTYGIFVFALNRKNILVNPNTECETTHLIHLTPLNDGLAGHSIHVLQS